MAAIADLSDLVNRLSGGSSGTPENLWFQKVARQAGAAGTAPIVGRFQSLWTFDGYPSGGVAPTTVAIPDNTTAGGLKQTDPGGGREKWLHSVWGSSLIAGTFILYDRLLHIGSLDGTSVAAQTVGGTLTRYTDGVGNIAFVEIYTQIGATSRTVTMSYSNTTPSSGRTSQAVAIGNTGFREATRVLMMPLAAGDVGISAVASVTLSATTGTAGNFGVTVGHPLAILDVPVAGAVGGRTFAQGLPGLPEIQTDACLAWLWLPQNATSTEIIGGLSMVEA